MKSKLLTIALLIVSVGLFSGCSTSQARYGKSEVNILGLVKVEQGTYSEVGPMTIGVKTSELVPRLAPSGGRVRFLYGLFTIADD